MKGIKRCVNTTNNPKLGPVFNFKEYAQQSAPFHNNHCEVDFVTYNGSLYVCVNDGVGFSSGDPKNNGFLLLVEKGADGRMGVDGKQGPMGPEPNYQLHFDGKQLAIIDRHGNRKAVSPELTGPSWFPELRNNKIVWVRKGADDQSVPKDIDLDSLRPIDEHPVLFRLNSDNTKRSDEETGPGYYIQWKYEGAENWTNLMSISELMNIALAGICFFQVEDPEATDIESNPVKKWHVGHKQVIRATYDSAKLGNRKIADVELGDVLFDAGEIPFPNYDDAIAALNAYLCELQDELDTTKASIPTKVSQLENDVPYIKTINGNHPNNAGELKLKTVDGNELVGEGDIPFATINGRPIVNTDENFEVPDDYLTQDDIKTVNGLSLIKNEDDPSGNINVGTVRSVSVNGGTKIGPDNTGNVNFTAGNNITLSTSGNSVTISSTGGSGGGDGIQDVEFRLSGNKLQFRLYINGNWGNWQDAVTLPSGGGNGEHVELTITGGNLYISYDEGEPQLVGSVGSGDTINGIVNVTINNNIMTFTKQDGTTIPIELPEGGSINLNNYYTKSEIDSMLAGAVPGISVPTYRPFILYKRTATTEVPTKPGTNAWKWYPNIDNLLHSASDSSVSVVDGWENNIPNATVELPFLWHSINVFSNVTGTSEGKEWSPAQRMTPVDGADGDDGDSIKFIFKLMSDSSDVPTAPSVAAPEFNNGWSDNASGIDINHKAEFYCISYCVEGVWSAWSGPYIWSLWGENGTDGNGVEYIYLSQGSSNVAVNNDPSKLADSVLESAAYQASDYVPKTGAQLISGTLGVDWTDEPTGVSSSYPFEFVSVRKYDGETQTWGAFSEPKVWAHFGQDGVGLVNNYIIVPISTNVAKVEVANSNPVSYTVNGTVTWELYDNGNKITNGYCQAYLGSYASGTLLTVNNSNGTYSTTVNSNWNGTAFLQILWFEGSNAQGKVLDSAIIPVIIPGEKGDAGSSTVQALDGPVMRVRTWTNGVQYYAENDPQDGISYIDVVYYNDNYYKCISSTNSVNPTNTTYWTPYSFLGDAAFETLLARSAYIQNLTSKQVVITDSNDQIEAGMASSQSVNNESALNGITVGSVRIWAGPISNGNLSTAPFTVTNDGVLKATAGQIGGSNGITFTSNGITLGSNCTISYNNLNNNLKDTIDNALDQNDVEGIIDNYVDQTYLTTVIGNHYIQTGQLTANDITTGTLDASQVTITNLTVDTIDANVISINGNPIDTSNPLKIVFANENTTSTTQANTIYFLY